MSITITVGEHKPRTYEFPDQTAMMAFLDGVLATCNITGDNLHVVFDPGL